MTSTATSLSQDFILKDVQVVKDVDGHKKYVGRSATVIELEYKGLKYAGQRILHRKDQIKDQVSASKDGAVSFQEECVFLSRVRHPNIVQFLGIFQPQGDSRAPILVMEFLPTSLTSCIEQYGILPKEISYSILHDVALGMHYLHSQTPPIIHRDLYSNNVLLTPNMTAKISDLGKAKILQNMLATTRMTGNPDKISFMPPEAMAANPKYDTCIDEFSYGIVMIHVLTGKWPEPEVGPSRVEPDDSVIPVSEAERRETLLNIIGNDHPLMKLIKDCIKNNYRSRAHAREIEGRLSEMVLRFPASFANQLEMLNQMKLLKQKHSSEVERLRLKITKLESELVQFVDKKEESTHLRKDNSTGQNAAEKEVEGANSSTDPVDDSEDNTAGQNAAKRISSTSDDSPELIMTGYPRESTSEESETLNLKNVQKELHIKVADEWEDIGIQLDIEEGLLNQIKSDNANNSKTCFREMMRIWLKRVNPPPSWSELANALGTLGNEDIASQIRAKYCV